MSQQSVGPAGLMPPDSFLGGHSHTRPNYDLRLRPTPTQETQELFDNMKKIERELDLHERIRLQGGQIGESGQFDNLEPPTPSQTTTMSRSSSVRSHTHSAAYSGAPVDIAEVVEQEERAGPARRRAIRHGPLDKYTKARAALLRKLGACDICRERKVKCTHHDLAEFERNYELRRQPQLVPQIRQPLSPLSSHNSYHPSPSQQSSQSPFLNPQAFLHIGEHVTNNSPSVLQYPGLDEQNGPTVELERMLRDMVDSPTPQRTAPSPAPLYDVSRQAETFPTLPTLSPPVFTPTETMGSPFAAPNDQYLPICRCVDGVWECQWSDGTDSSECGSDTDVCGLRHPGLDSLSKHFWSAHAPFQEAEPPFFWICMQCRLKWTEQAEVCPQSHCSGHRTFERWYFGRVAVPPTQSSPSSIRVSNYGTPQMKPPAGPARAVGTGSYGASLSMGKGSVNWAEGLWGSNIPQFRTGGSACAASSRQARDKRAEVVSASAHWKSHETTQFPNHLVSSGLERPLLLDLLALYPWRRAWSDGFTGVGKLSMHPLQTLPSTRGAVRRHVQQLSVIVVVVWLATLWLYRNNRVHLNRPSVTSSVCPSPYALCRKYREGRVIVRDWLIL